MYIQFNIDLNKYTADVAYFKCHYLETLPRNNNRHDRNSRQNCKTSSAVKVPLTVEGEDSQRSSSP